MIREDGFFATVSDFGNYAYWWTATGSKDVRKFFLRAEQDWDYFARKLRPEWHINEEESFNAVILDILKERSHGELSKADARERYDHVKYYSSDDDWEGFLRDSSTHTFWDEPWNYGVSELNSDVVCFAKKILPQVAKLIEAELEREEAEASNARRARALFRKKLWR